MNRNTTLSIVIFIICIVGVFAVMLVRDSGANPAEGLFMSYVDVIAEDTQTHQKRYIAISYSEYQKDLEPFEPDPMNVCETGEGAFTSEADGQHVHNTLVDDTLYDESGAAVPADEARAALLRRAAELDGPVDTVRIFEVSDRLFAQITVSIDAWHNHLLYEYDAKKDKLIHLGSFFGEEVAGLRLPAAG